MDKDITVIITLYKTPTNKINHVNFNLSDSKKAINVISSEKPDHFFLLLNRI